MKKTLIITLAIFIIQFSIAQASGGSDSNINPSDIIAPDESTDVGEKPQKDSLPDMGKMTEKEKLKLELRFVKDLKERSEERNIRLNQNPSAEADKQNSLPVHVEHPEFGLKDLYPDEPTPELDPQTESAIKTTQKWLHMTNTPVVQQGKIIHPFGSGIPTLVLEPLAISNIQLSPDETIVPKGIQIGDPVNWGVEETYGGSKRGRYPNLIVKSRSLDEMKTILIIITTKRTYHIQLVSTYGNWTPQLAFSYPENGVERSPETLTRLMSEKNNESTAGAKPPEIEHTDSYLYAAGDIDFGYSIKGDKKILPARVFSLGHQTVIEMSKSISKINAPGLILEDSEGNNEMVNYRFVNHRYILDQPIYKAFLISGVGWDQSKVTIEKLEN